MGKNLHIVSFNVPYPADYGGVIDVFYRIQALSRAGVKIYLHCFVYGRDESNELSHLCEKVYYYPRSKSFLYQFSKLPFIVKTRASKDLLVNLMKDDSPILFEGLHSCFFLGRREISNRLKIVRNHNVEHHYYNELSHKSSKLLQKLYFKLEAYKLKYFESILNEADHIAAISESDYNYLKSRYNNVFLMPPSHENNIVKSKTGNGSYILYHGNLSVQENEEAALFVVGNIAPKVPFKFIISGKDPGNKIIQAVNSVRNVDLIINPLQDEMQNLIDNAHVNLLPTFQATGFKLKLLNALFNGRFCVGTPQLVAGTGLERLCFIAESSNGLVTELNKLITIEFTSADIEKRKALLVNYTNSASITGLLSLI
jgi:glycosyltransferase involved in cell wall biosynthesis